MAAMEGTREGKEERRYASGRSAAGRRPLTIVRFSRSRLARSLAFQGASSTVLAIDGRLTYAGIPAGQNLRKTERRYCPGDLEGPKGGRKREEKGGAGPALFYSKPPFRGRLMTPLASKNIFSPGHARRRPRFPRPRLHGRVRSSHRKIPRAGSRGLRAPQRISAPPPIRSRGSTQFPDVPARAPTEGRIPPFWWNARNPTTANARQ